MPFIKGQSGNPAGKPPGTKNKRKVWHQHIAGLCDHNHYCPFQTMIEIASNPDNPSHTRLTASNEIAQYMAPKVRSIDLSGGDNAQPVTFQILTTAQEGSTHED